MERTRPGTRDHLDGLPPGAERFWGQFAETRAGRTSCQEEADRTPNDDETSGQSAHQCVEWCPICRSAELAGSSAPPDLFAYLQTIQGDLLTILRAFMEAYAERISDIDHGDGRGHSATTDD